MLLQKNRLISSDFCDCLNLWFEWSCSKSCIKMFWCQFFSMLIFSWKVKIFFGKSKFFWKFQFFFWKVKIFLEINFFWKVVFYWKVHFFILFFKVSFFYNSFFWKVNLFRKVNFLKVNYSVKSFLLESRLFYKVISFKYLFLQFGVIRVSNEIFRNINFQDEI